jgi:translocation protein SEC63
VITDSNIGTIKVFDPWEILDVTSDSTPKEIKSAFRRLSLIYHPDKNQNDNLAAGKFMQITKAYDVLTSELARSNYEKYGNPDGPQPLRFGIGIP